MTVGDLITKLRALPEDMLVACVEGVVETEVGYRPPTGFVVQRHDRHEDRDVNMLLLMPDRREMYAIFPASVKKSM